ncbi:hypothetical protein MKX67_08875 [Cytobacillus sp. FSL W7-1323]|uniref:hypothetical protein n=1 Tax=Cytobacillus sp. FSL W7-1323 TaxID=2921700 RepID=UPI00315841F1
MANELTEREMAIMEAKRFVTIPEPDYSQMSIDEIRKRIEYMESAFRLAFENEEDDDVDL